MARSTDQWCTLLVCEKYHTARELPVQPKDALGHEERAQDGKGKGSPVHKGVVLLSEDTEEGPRNGDRCGQVTLSGGVSVSCGSAFEEEATPQESAAGGHPQAPDDLQCEEDENLGPDTGDFDARIDAKCFKGSENYQNGGPSVPKRERQMHKYLVAHARRRMVLLDDVVDVLTRV